MYVNVASSSKPNQNKDSTNEKTKRNIYYKDLKNARRTAEKLKVKNNLLKRSSKDFIEIKPAKRTKSEDKDLRAIRRILITEFKKAQENQFQLAAKKSYVDAFEPGKHIMNLLPVSAKREIGMLIYKNFKKVKSDIKKLKEENKLLSKSISSEYIHSVKEIPTKIKSTGKKNFININKKMYSNINGNIIKQLTELTEQNAGIDNKKIHNKDRSKNNDIKVVGKKPAKSDDDKTLSKFQVLMEIAKLGDTRGQEELKKKLNDFKMEFIN